MMTVKKILIEFSLGFLLLSIIGCNNRNISTTLSNNTFNEVKAISMVVKDHTDFPLSQSETLSKELPIGGPQGSTAKVKFTTKVEESSESAYVVTLTKDWGISVNGKYVKSSWKYNVTPDRVTLLESTDNDYLPSTMK